MPSVYVKTLGCKVNSFDGQALAARFQAGGYHLLPSADGADITVVNTCSVTANAEREARYLARRLRRDSPDTVLVFTGCYAQTDSARLVGMEEIDFVVPNAAKDELVGLVTARLQGAEGHSDGKGSWHAMGSDMGGDTGNEAEGAENSAAFTANSKLPPGMQAVQNNRQTHFKSSLTLFDATATDQTRAFLKVQDGCNGFCTYCLIPYARGASRSVPALRVLAEVERLVAGGCEEIVLTGIHLGDYGQDFAPAGNAEPFVALVQDILQRLAPSTARLRLSSLEPIELSPALAELLAAHRHQVCDHFHLPLQSGSDRILGLMRRTYDRERYRAAVDLIRRHFPEACIGADVIPGFPSESEQDFRDTNDFVKDLDLAYLHVFPYSARPNTAAVRMPGHLEPKVVKERALALRQLSDELSHAYARRFIGRTLPVLWEDDQDGQGHRLGRTPNYLSVAASGERPAVGTRNQVTLKGFVDQGRLLGRVLS